MHIRLGFLGAIAFPCLLFLSFSESAFSQPADRLTSVRALRQAKMSDPGYTHFNCEGSDKECLISETPVPGVRMVRPKDYPLRPAHYLSSNLYTTLAADRETANRFVAFDFQVTPGGGPLPHTHRNEWETFFVSDGTMEFDELNPNPPFAIDLVNVAASTVVYGPQGPVHGFINKSGMSGRIFSFAMPAGLDQFFHNSGEEVVDFNAPIPAISNEEIVRTAFWAEQRGDALWIVGLPPPVLPAGTPNLTISSTKDAKRPTETGPFGEKRVVLLTPTEVGNITAATAFCGPGIPGRPGGTVKYSYLALPTQQSAFPGMYTSQNTEVFYTLGGALSFSFGGLVQKSVTLEPGTYVQIDAGVPFSIANLPVNGQTSVPAASLAISVLPPAVCPTTGPPATSQTVAIAGPKNLTVTSRSAQLDGSKSTSADGKPLAFLWTIPPGGATAAILNATTATPTVQFTQGHTIYTFQLTVTDSTGKTSTDVLKVDYEGN